MTAYKAGDPDIPPVIKMIMDECRIREFRIFGEVKDEPLDHAEH